MRRKERRRSLSVQSYKTSKNEHTTQFAYCHKHLLENSHKLSSTIVIF